MERRENQTRRVKEGEEKRRGQRREERAHKGRGGGWRPREAARARAERVLATRAPGSRQPPKCSARLPLRRALKLVTALEFRVLHMGCALPAQPAAAMIALSSSKARTAAVVQRGQS